LLLTQAVTISPAKAIHRENEMGSIGLNREADVTVLKIVEPRKKRSVESVDMNDQEQISEDSQGNVRVLSKIFEPIAVFRAGKAFQITE